MWDVKLVRCDPDLPSSDEMCTPSLDKQQRGLFTQSLSGAYIQELNQTNISVMTGKLQTLGGGLQFKLKGRCLLTNVISVTYDADEVI